MNYRIIANETKFLEFLDFLPDLLPHEVYYLSLFGRRKYDETLANKKDNQLARVVARDKADLLEKIRRLESPVGSYTRDGETITQNALAVYLALNPRSLLKANKGILVEMATRFSQGRIDFNPLSVCTTEIHRAVDRKFFVDFDYDDVEPSQHLPRIKEILTDPGMYRIVKTRGGFHLLVVLDKIRELKTRWHLDLSDLPNCDVRGSNSLCPVPGCVQGDFVPHFWE
jgi:hypothetical protein